MATNNDAINKSLSMATGVAKQVYGHVTGDDELYQKGVQEREAAVSLGENTSTSNASSSMSAPLDSGSSGYSTGIQASSIVDAVKSATTTTVQTVKEMTGLADKHPESGKNV